MKNELDSLHTNQRVLIDALLKRGAKVTIIDQTQELVRVSYKGKESYLLDRFNEQVPYSLVVLSASKIWVKNLLFKNKISVPLGNTFSGAYKDDVLQYAAELGYPLVLKPNWGSHGDFVYSGIQNQCELSDAIAEYAGQYGQYSQFIVEEYFPGAEHRIFMNQLGEYAVLKREPAYIIGNGRHTINKLVLDENERRVALKKKDRTSQLCPIVLDEHIEKHLSNSDLNLSYLPKSDEKIYLRLTSNIAKGGVSHNMTNIAHPTAINIVEKCASVIKLPFMGVDFITSDITKPQTMDSYRIIEVNSSPGFAMHLYPCNGQPVNVAEFAANVLFGKEK